MTTPFAKAKTSSVGRERREHGGDNEVERDGNGRPRILVPCDRCPGTGKVPSEKVAGRLNKCQRCKGEGSRKVAYTRVTTFIDALEDKRQLKTWHGRMVLIGAATDPGLLTDVLSMDPEDDDDKDQLNRRAEAAAVLAGAGKKADHGTLLHTYSEDCDNGIPLPEDADPQDWLDIMSYKEATWPLLKIVHMEQLMVNDLLETGGTPDRVSSVREGVKLSAPNGYVFEDPSELIITDLKTGRIDYGALKMAQQLALYSRSKLYDKATGDRIELENLNQEWGIIMHTVPGTGQTTLYWVDLTIGWEATLLSSEVRDVRRRGKHALTLLTGQGASPLTKAA